MQFLGNVTTIIKSTSLIILHKKSTITGVQYKPLESLYFIYIYIYIIYYVPPKN
jgi:hypothetical protein